MSQSEPTPNSRIELDLGEPGLGQEALPRRSRPAVQESMAPLPKIEPMMAGSDVGADEAERMVGLFFLLSALPGLVSALMGHSAAGLLSLAIPIYFGIGLLRGDDFVKEWVFLACIVQLVLGPVSSMVSSRPIVFILAEVAQTVGLLVLVSGRALSKQTYRICLGTVGLGVLIDLVGSLVH